MDSPIIEAPSASEGPNPVEWLRTHPTQVALVMGACLAVASPGLQTQLDQQNGPFYDALAQADMFVRQHGLNYGLETMRYILDTLSSAIPQENPGNPVTAQAAEFLLRVNALATVGGTVAKVTLPRLMERVFQRNRIARYEGKMPLSQNQRPAHVLVGPSQIISDIAGLVAKDTPHEEKRPIVGIHLGSDVPPSWGRDMEYHFGLQTLPEINGPFPHTEDNRTFVNAVGLDRAKEITIVNFNPDNALFYGADVNAEIPGYYVSTLLQAIPEESLRGKKVRALLSGELFFAQTTPVNIELQAMADRVGFELSIVNPETVILDEIRNRLSSAIDEKKNSGEPVRIVLAGKGTTPEDRTMLTRFGNALSLICNDADEAARPQVQVVVVDDFRIGDRQISVDDPTDAETRDRLLQDVIIGSDINICYGDDDSMTTTVQELVIAKGGDREKTVGLVERTQNIPDFESRDFQYIPVYQTVLQAAT